jgi:hypothetical protein
MQEVYLSLPILSLQKTLLVLEHQTIKRSLNATVAP